MKQILTWLSGKKTTIVAEIALITSFMVLKQLIDADTSVFINSVILLLAFGANATTGRIVYGQ